MMAKRTATFEIVTPEKAEKWLAECNTHNRRENEARSDRYANYIRKHQFATTHQGIAFDQDGVLLDGQNRLRAIIKAHTAVELLVVRGLDRTINNGVDIDIQGLMDVGGSRSAGQQLMLDYGMQNANRKAAAAKIIIAMTTTSGIGKGVGIPEILEVVKIFGEDIDAVLGVRWKDPTFKVAPIFGVLSFAYSIAPEKVTWFTERLASMENVPSKSQVAHLYHWLQKNQTAAQTGSGGRMVFCRVVALAVANHLRGVKRGLPTKNDAITDEGIEYLKECNRAKVIAVQKMLSPAK